MGVGFAVWQYFAPANILFFNIAPILKEKSRKGHVFLKFTQKQFDTESIKFVICRKFKGNEVCLNRPTRI
jgi:hypothetical protein